MVFEKNKRKLEDQKMQEIRFGFSFRLSFLLYLVTMATMCYFCTLILSNYVHFTLQVQMICFLRVRERISMDIVEERFSNIFDFFFQRHSYM